MIPPDGRFNQKYQLLAVLGTGATKTVWKAHDTMQEREVALKIYELSDAALRAHYPARDLESIARNEAVALTRIGAHPCIARIFDANVDATTGKFFIAEEYLPGKNLADALKGADLMKTATHRAIKRYAREILRGLEHLRRNAIVHSDLKLENILVSGNRVAITDFGSAAVPEHPFASAGALRYLSPEWIRNGRRTPASDMWQFGILLYAATTGTYPFASSCDDWSGASPEEIRTYRQELKQAIVQKSPIRPRQQNPHIPERLERVILACLDKSPEKRPSPRKARWMLRPSWLVEGLTASVLAGCALGGAIYAVQQATPAEDDRLVYISHENGQRDLYAMDTQGFAKTRLTNDLLAESCLTGTADGRVLAYAKSLPGQAQLVLRESDGIERIIATSEKYHAIEFSPDERVLAASSTREQGTALELIDVKKGTRNSVNAPWSDELHWNPQGTYLSLLYNRQLFFVKPTGELRQVDEIMQPVRSHCWTNDGLVVSLEGVGPAGRVAHFSDVSYDRVNLTPEQGISGFTASKLGALKNRHGVWYITNSVLEIQLRDKTRSWIAFQAGPLQSDVNVVAVAEGATPREWYIVARREDLDGSGTLDENDNVIYRFEIQRFTNFASLPPQAVTTEFKKQRAIDGIFYTPSR